MTNTSFPRGSTESLGFIFKMEKQNTTQDVINDIINPYSEYAKGFYDGIIQEQKRILQIIDRFEIEFKQNMEELIKLGAIKEEKTEGER